MIRIFPYRQKSRSANRLAQVLGGKVMNIKTMIIPQTWDVVINWGSSECPYGVDVRVLNRPSAIRTASNKREAFRVLQQAGVQIPAFATSKADVSWEGLTVVRHKLTGHSGEGIELVDDKAALPVAPLYVEYIPKKDEYRIHVIGTSITTIQRKGARSDFDGKPDFKVRNHKNGFVFVRQSDVGGPITPPLEVLEQARAAIAALGLDFGAVDIVWNEKAKKAYVLEVNTAPGMEGTTIAEYAAGFKELLK